MRGTLWLLAVLVTGCATDASEHRRSMIDTAERLLPKIGDSPDAADLRFQLAAAHCEEADALEKTPGSESLAVPHWSAAIREYDYVVQHFPDYERLPEVLFWRAEALTRDRSWARAVDAWRLSRANPPTMKGQDAHSRYRMAQALRRVGGCDEALSLLEPLRDQQAERERCQCLVTLDRRAGPCGAPADGGAR